MSDCVRPADFAGLRVISFESRRAALMEQSIQQFGGDAFVAPSVNELPFKQHDEIFDWADRLSHGDFDMVVWMTGAGLTFLRDIVSRRYPRDVFAALLRRVTTVSRGPKPALVLQEMGVRATIVVPEPNTWQEIVHAIAARPERRITVQEYGCANPQLIDAIRRLGKEVSAISIYCWTLPDDLGPLREAARRMAARECDVILFTTSIQLTHLLVVAKQMGLAGAVREALREDLVIGSVGPVMNSTLADHGFTPDVVPAHPKLAMLVRAAAELAPSILARKRRAAMEKCG